MAEEEEASASACSLARLEDLLAVEEGTEGLFQHLVVAEVLFKSVHEKFTLVERDQHIGLQGDHLNLRGAPQ